MQPSTWTWNGPKEEAAQLLAEGRLQVQEIAVRLQISTATIRNWKKNPEFHDRVAQNVAVIREGLQKECLTRIQQRAHDLHRLLDAMSQSVDQIKPKDLLAINKNPVTAINLLLRLHHAVDNFERKRESLNAEYDDIEIPDFNDLEPEVAQAIDGILERARTRSSHLGPLPATNLS